MRTYKIALIRVVTLENEILLNKHAEILENYFPEYEFESFCIPDQKNGIFSEKSHLKSIPKIIELAKDISDKFDGILVSCAADPAVEELKRELDIVVEGAGKAASLISLNYSNKIGVVGMGDYKLNTIIETLGENLVAYRLMGNINNTHDFGTAASKKFIKSVLKELKDAGAEAIILACTGMSALEITGKLSKELSITVIDPLLSAAVMLKSQLILRELE